MHTNTALLAADYRGGLLDLTHYGYISVVDENGNEIYSAGNTDEVIFYRSASKPIQALPVIARNLDIKYGLTDEETVLFAGSHEGESFHISALKSIMEKAGLSEDDLIMKPTAPGNPAANEERIRQGLGKSRLYHNCSGKHAALMLIQRDMGVDVRDYWKVDSVGEREVLRTMSVFSEYPDEDVKIGIDGCGVPVFAYPVKNIAIAFKNLACPEKIKDDVLGEAAARYVPRINRYPLLIKGTGGLCSLLNATPNIIAKGGANGVYALGLKKERIGIVFKTVDGSDRCRPIVLREIFRQIGYRDALAEEVLDSFGCGIVVNDNGTPVGETRAEFSLVK